MNYIDAIILVILLVAAIIGLKKGFVRQLFGLAALFIGVFCAYHFSSFAAGYIVKWFHPGENLTQILAFIVTFLAVLLLIVFLGRLVEGLLRITALGLFNRILGLVFSVAKNALILSILIYLLEALDALWSFLPRETCESSLLYGPFSDWATALFPYLKRLAEVI
jgi:Uncharacterized membrane protein, required for colicin V production